MIDLEQLKKSELGVIKPARIYELLQCIEEAKEIINRYWDEEEDVKSIEWFFKYFPTKEK